MSNQIEAVVREMVAELDRQYIQGREGPYVPDATDYSRVVVDGPVDMLALARVVLAETLKWHPIETAPKDGTSVLLWGVEEGDPPNRAAHWIGTFLYGVWVVDGRNVDAPTHWQPLPAPPQE